MTTETTDLHQRLLDRMEANLTNPNYLERAQAIDAVGRIGIDAIPYLLDALNRSQRTANAMKIAEVFSHLRLHNNAPQVLDLYLDALKIDSPFTRYYMLIAIGKFVYYRINTKNPDLTAKALEVVSPFLEDKNRFVQSQAVSCIAMMSLYGNVTHIPKLLGMLQDNWQSPQVALVYELIDALHSVYWLPAIPTLDKIAKSVAVGLDLPFAAQLAIGDIIEHHDNKQGGWQ